MQQAANIFQRIYGVVLLVFVGMYLFEWEPPPIEAAAQPLWDAIIGSGYIMPIVTLTYAVTGLSFLANRFVPLAAVLLVPVSLNILLFHSFLNPRSIPFAATFFVGNAIVLYTRRHVYSNLLKPNVSEA